MSTLIPFNKPYLAGNELQYIERAVASGKISGNGDFTKRCQNFFETKYHFKKCYLTTSCTDALEMCALLLDIQPGDEIIMPAYTFVSTANAFVLRGAKIVFVDSRRDHPGMDEMKIQNLITSKTKAIVVVHYAGVACDMDVVMDISRKNGLYVIEDAAHSIDSYFIGKNGDEVPLGSIGHLAAFSFHETKNIISGEGGMLVVNDQKFKDRAEILWEKGTNRSAFFRGEVDKYNWVDVGSSFLPSEIIAAYLWGQLEKIEEIQSKRIDIWNMYQRRLKKLGEESNLQLPSMPEFATNNGHMYYVVCENTEQRSLIIKNLKEEGILAVFHYLSLNESPFYQKEYTGDKLRNSDRYSECLLRLPFFFELKESEIDLVTKTIYKTFESS